MSHSRPGHYSDECEFLGDFGTNYAKGKPTKDHGNNSIPGEKNNRQLENNSIIKNVVDEIILNETQKVSAARESPEFLDSGYDANDLYQVEK